MMPKILELVTPPKVQHTILRQLTITLDEQQLTVYLIKILGTKDNYYHIAFKNDHKFETHYLYLSRHTSTVFGFTCENQIGSEAQVIEEFEKVVDTDLILKAKSYFEY